MQSRRINVTPGQDLSILLGDGGAPGAGGAGSNANPTSWTLPGIRIATKGGTGSTGGGSTVSVVGGSILVSYAGAAGGTGGMGYAIGFETAIVGTGGSQEGGSGNAASGILIRDGGAGGDALNCGSQEDGGLQYSISGYSGVSSFSYSGGNGGGGNGGPWFAALGSPGCGGGGGGGGASPDDPPDSTIYYGVNGGQGRKGAPGIIIIWY